MRGLLVILCLALLTLPAAAEGVIGGVGLTHLTVYEQRPAPDGLNSGCPHVHAVTDEAYYVISGSGRVELHDLKHGMKTVELKQGQYLQFPPGALHRIISVDHLTILAVMGNAGLAEAGDARIYFGKKVDEDPAEFARLAGLAKAKGLEGALDRRDAAVKAYQGLLELWKGDRKAYFAELRRFINAHLAAVQKRREQFASAVADGPLAWGKRSERRLAELPSLDQDLEPRFHDAESDFAYGMCGILRPVTTLQPIK